MALNTYQLISRVLAGRPFGDGRHGAYSSATIPTFVKDGCSGTGGTTSLTTENSTFANGDVILIHQARGSGVGGWEINSVASGGGTASLTLTQNLNQTYINSGASQAQAVRVQMYNTVNPSSGTWTATSWDGSTGGLMPIACNVTFAPTNTITLSGRGYAGGTGHSATSSDHNTAQGEGTTGAGGTELTSSNGSGGGGGEGGNQGRGGGGGGGHVSSGTTGQTSVGGQGGTGGDSSGSSELTTMTFGGGGGSGGADSADASTGGAEGGGILMIFARNIDVSGATIATNGGDGNSESEAGGGGGGGGGAVLIECQTAVLGTNKITASGGAGGISAAQGDGGAGSNGIIAIHYSSNVTGTTSPTFTQVFDGRLIEQLGGLMFFV